MYPDNAMHEATPIMLASAMPISKNRLGYLCANRYEKVLLDKSASSATTEGFLSPKLNRLWPNALRVDIFIAASIVTPQAHQWLFAILLLTGFCHATPPCQLLRTTRLCLFWSWR